MGYVKSMFQGAFYVLGYIHFSDFNLQKSYISYTFPW